ncbi:hypothetical protein [Streptomyces sp. 6N223]|uniref:hypothetical protein n=1 Tax=Streptomyces sp. 6N223 TaxID=3457412 RepID=UPI003FCFF517
MLDVVRQVSRRDSALTLTAPKTVRDGQQLFTDTTGRLLRHGYAGLPIHAGESVRVVAERMGHKDATITLRVCAHLMRGGEDRTREAVGRALGSP